MSNEKQSGTEVYKNLLEPGNAPAPPFLGPYQVVELNFVLKHTKLKEKLEKKLISNGNGGVSVLKSVLPENLNPVSKSFKLYFGVVNPGKPAGHTSLLSHLGNYLFETYFENFFSSNVVLTTIQIRRLEPLELKTNRYSIGAYKTGKSDVQTPLWTPPSPAFFETSSRSFVFNLASDRIQGGSDDFTIRLPFVSNALQNPYVNFGGGSNGKPVDKICRDFEKNIVIPGLEQVSGGDSLEIRLMVKSQKVADEAKFFPVDYVAVNGFVAAGTKSAIQAPIDNGNGWSKEHPPQELNGSESDDDTNLAGDQAGK